LHCLLGCDSTSIIFDLRANNGRPKDTRHDEFWDALDAYLKHVSVVHEKRHHEHMYMPLPISTEDLTETVNEDLPEGTLVPSASWLAYNFLPTNAYVR